MKISVIVPVYNESPTLGIVLDRLALLPMDKEVIVIDDGSSDGTAEVARSHASLPRVEQFGVNRGKGAAVRRGFEVASGQIVVIQDADLELAPEIITNLIPPIVSGEADAVYGSRFVNATPQVPAVRRAANRLITVLTNRLYGTLLTDAETAHKAMRKSMLDGFDLESDRFDIEIELTAKLARAGARFVEIASPYQPRTKHDGKKIGWRDGLAAISALLRYRRWQPSEARTSRR